MGSRLNSDSILVVHGLSYPAACGMFLDQGWNPCLLHCQVDSTEPPGKPETHFFFSHIEAPLLFFVVVAQCPLFIYSSFSDHSWLMVLWVVFSCLLLQTIL